jgi:hypothetical protein
MNNTQSLATELIIVGEGSAPMLLCERHATALKAALEAGQVTYASFGIGVDNDQVQNTELDPEMHLCQACNLSSELAQPRIILPD